MNLKYFLLENLVLGREPYSLLLTQIKYKNYGVFFPQNAVFCSEFFCFFLTPTAVDFGF